MAHSYQATITGYAYETVPGKAILAGHTSGPAVNAELLPPASQQKSPAQEASLGLLTIVRAFDLEKRRKTATEVVCLNICVR